MQQIKQIIIENGDFGDAFFKSLAEREDVFIIYNVYNIMSRYPVFKDIEPDDCFRVKPFRKYWERNHEKPFFADILQLDLCRGRMMLISIT